MTAISEIEFRPNEGEEYNYFEYFSGAVPSGLIFQMQADEIAKISVSSKDESYSLINSLCLIGLASYFEAFVKDHLASILSLAPELIEKLNHAGYTTDIPAQEALEQRDDLQFKIGFLIAQRLDMGSAKKINAAFLSLLRITPLGKKDVATYDNLLRDRNLLVHHGGTYTTSYIRQAFNDIPIDRRRAHMDSLNVTSSQIEQTSNFLKRIAWNTIRESSSRLHEIFAGRILSSEIIKALEAMCWWDPQIDDYAT